MEEVEKILEILNNKSIEENKMILDTVLKRIEKASYLRFVK